MDHFLVIFFLVLIPFILFFFLKMLAHRPQDTKKELKIYYENQLRKYSQRADYTQNSAVRSLCEYHSLTNPCIKAFYNPWMESFYKMNGDMDLEFYYAAYAPEATFIVTEEDCEECKREKQR